MTLWDSPALSGLLAGGYLALMSLMWGALVLTVPLWARGFRLDRPAHPAPAAGPSLTICIPARNEALNIGAALRSALAVQWPDIELIVVDDRSTDGTGERAREAAGGDPRMRLIAGTEPPAGWAGKVWACARAAAEARGAWLLFMDADVVLDPQAPAALIAEADRRRLSLLSAFGSWTLVGFWERALIPAVGWLIRGAVDLDKVNDPGRPEAFANGQLILARRDIYEELGGHGMVSGAILDDVRLAESWKRRGGAIGLVAAPWAFQVRLYRSLSEIIAGYSKNLYEGMGRRPFLGLGAVLFIFVGTLLPHLLLAMGLIGRLALGWGWPGPGWLLWTGLICAAQYLFRYRVERRDGRSGAIAWAHPLANVLLVWILLRSVFGLRQRWKGRLYSDGRAS